MSKSWYYKLQYVHEDVLCLWHHMFKSDLIKGSWKYEEEYSQLINSRVICVDYICYNVKVYYIRLT